MIHTLEQAPAYQTKKPLKLISSTSPKTSVFEKQFRRASSYNLNSYFQKNRPSPSHVNVGSYNVNGTPPSPPISYSRSTGGSSPLGSIASHGSHAYSPTGSFNSSHSTTSLEVQVKIPLHRLRSTSRTLSGFLNSITKDDLDRCADFISYATVGGFAVFSENILLINKQLFTILTPLVVIAVLKIAMKSEYNVLVGHSIDQMLIKKKVPYDIQRLICQTVVFLKTLLLVLAGKSTSTFKKIADYRSHLDQFTLAVLGLLIVTVVISLFYNIVTALTLKEDVSSEPVQHEILTMPVTRSPAKSFYKHQKLSARAFDELNPPYEDYCMLDSPESLDL